MIHQKNRMCPSKKYHANPFKRSSTHEKYTDLLRYNKYNALTKIIKGNVYKQILVLDLDLTLIHSSQLPLKNHVEMRHIVHQDLWASDHMPRNWFLSFQKCIILWFSQLPCNHMPTQLLTILTLKSWSASDFIEKTAFDTHRATSRTWESSPKIFQKSFWLTTPKCQPLSILKTQFSSNDGWAIKMTESF